LIANISHQWRDGITKIGFINLNVIARLKMNKEITKEYLQQSTRNIEKTLDFMSMTMQNFLDFYRPSTTSSSFDAKESILGSMSIIQTKIRNNNVSIKIVGKEDIHIEGIKNQWMQVWLNLLNNSINQAIKNNITSPYIKIHINDSFLFFHDNCGGFSANMLEQISKKDFPGLGLKMSKQIVQKYGYDLELSNLQEGAFVKIKKQPLKK
jgi:nitrogen fixation/metabolism regulation signal transduction histidine kinase